MSRIFVLLALLSSCGTPPSLPDASVFVPTQTRLLGLNDVTWLLPLDAGTFFPPAIELIPFASFERLTTTMPQVRTELSRLRVVGLRFDICDRAQPIPCAADADGVFRLVLQPVSGSPPRTEDIAFHAFFAVPRADVPAVVDELRALAALQDLDRSSALQVNTASAAHHQQLAALVGRYAMSTRLHRLTLFGQESDRAALAWIFRGEERAGAGLAPIELPSALGTQQEVLLFGGDSYVVSPLAEVPAGFTNALMEPSFRNSSPALQLQSVQALAAVDNPTLHTANTVQCASCHLSTTLLPPRASDAGIDLSSLPEVYRSAAFDQSALGAQTIRFRTLRALGYLGDQPLVSQRVINETAHVLEELEQRFPAAAP